ncbi:MAG: HIRAN domain-containing protein [Tannerellaceae bacterium]|nr:HIRAN domain-containing protein [Tannerellaceae bacterium]
MMTRKHVTHFEIAGFTYYEGPIVFTQLKVGASLQLVAEPENKFDPNAVAIYFGEEKIGFISREKNELFSLFFEQGYKNIFEAYINRLSPDAYPERQVGVAVYLKAR